MIHVPIFALVQMERAEAPEAEPGPGPSCGEGRGMRVREKSLALVRSDRHAGLRIQSRKSGSLGSDNGGQKGQRLSNGRI